MAEGAASPCTSIYGAKFYLHSQIPCNIYIMERQMSPDPDLLRTTFFLSFTVSPRELKAAVPPLPAHPQHQASRAGRDPLLSWVSLHPGLGATELCLLSIQLPKQAAQCMAPKHTHICVTEAHGTRLPLAQKQELVVGIDVRRAPILLVPAAHLAGVIRFCKKAAQPHQPLQPTRTHTVHVPQPTLLLLSFPRGRQDYATP